MWIQRGGGAVQQVVLRLRSCPSPSPGWGCRLFWRFVRLWRNVVSRARLIGALALAATASLALSACAGGSTGGTGGGGGDVASVKIGFMGDLTGGDSGIVIPPNNGAKMAIDEYNATNPKTKIELV